MDGNVAVSLPEPEERWRKNKFALGQDDILIGSTVIVRTGMQALLEDLFMERSHNKRLALELRRKLAQAKRRGFKSTLVNLNDLDFLLTKFEEIDT